VGRTYATGLGEPGYPGQAGGAGGIEAGEAEEEGGRAVGGFAGAAALFEGAGACAGWVPGEAADFEDVVVEGTVQRIGGFGEGGAGGEAGVDGLGGFDGAELLSGVVAHDVEGERREGDVEIGGEIGEAEEGVAEGGRDAGGDFGGGAEDGGWCGHVGLYLTGGRGGKCRLGAQS